MDERIAKCFFHRKYIISINGFDGLELDYVQLG